MKVCGSCKQEKPDDAYHKCTRRKDGLQNECKQCRALRHKQTYDDTRKIAIRQRQAARRKELQEKINALKVRPCTDCSGIFPPYVMDFDHLPGRRKVDAVSQMALDVLKWKTIEEEIAKCELVCANCHRIRTHNRAAA